MFELMIVIIKALLFMVAYFMIVTGAGSIVKIRCPKQIRFIVSFLTGNLILILVFFFSGSFIVGNIAAGVKVFCVIGFSLFFYNFKSLVYPLKISLNKKDILILLFFICIFGFHLLRNLMPVVAFDPQIYHFSLPLQYLAENRIFPDLKIPWSFYPPGSQFIYGTGFILYGETGAKLINLLFGVMSFIFIFILSRRFFPNQYIFTVGVFLSAPLLGFANIKSGNENFEIFAFMCFAYGLLYPKKLYKLLFVSSLMLLFLKYTYLLVLPCILISVVIHQYIKMKKFYIKHLMIVIIAFIVFSPFLLRNYLLVGNPIYPVENSFFSSVENQDVEGFGTTSLFEDYGLEKNSFDYFKLPWNIVMNEISFNYEWNGVGYMLLIAFPVWLTIKGSQITSSRIFIFIGICYFLLWMLFMPHIIRFSLAGFSLMIFSVSACARKLKRSRRFLYYIFVAVFICSVTFYPNWPNYFSGNWRIIDLDVITNRITPMEYLVDQSDRLFNYNNIKFVTWVNKTFEGKKLYTSEECRSYYIRKSVDLECVRWSQKSNFIIKMQDIIEIKQMAYKVGVKYFVIQYIDGKIAWDLLTHPVWGNLNVIKDNFDVIYCSDEFIVIQIQ